MRQITFRIEKDVTLDPIWFDEQHYAEMLEDGATPEQALKQMVRESMEEDWTSLLEEAFATILPPDAAGRVRADWEPFLAAITRIDLIGEQ